MLMKDVEEYGERALQNLQKALDETKAPVADDESLATASCDTLDSNTKAAMVKMNRAARLLQNIIAIIHPQRHSPSPLPVLDLNSLDQSIENMNEAFQKMIDEIEKEEAAGAAAKGIVHATGKGMIKICSYITPFLKVFLTVGVNASAVSDSDIR